MSLKNKIEQFRSIIGNFDKLEKSVQAKLMAVADRLAPKVQGGDIAPKEMTIPEPIEYPDITKKPVPMGKHVYDSFIDSFQKSSWQPIVLKTEKHPNNSVPFVQAPEKGGPINPDNLTEHQRALRDKK